MLPLPFFSFAQPNYLCHVCVCVCFLALSFSSSSCALTQPLPALVPL